MTTRKLLLVLAFIGAAAAPLSAMAGVHFVPVGGEPGYKFRYVSSSLTRVEKRAQDRIQAAADAAQRSGWRLAGGEKGWVYDGHKYEFVGNKLVCVDGIDHSTKPSFAPLADASIYRGA